MAISDSVHTERLDAEKPSVLIAVVHKQLFARLNDARRLVEHVSIELYRLHVLLRHRIRTCVDDRSACDLSLGCFVRTVDLLVKRMIHADGARQCALTYRIQLLLFGSQPSTMYII